MIVSLSSWPACRPFTFQDATRSRAWLSRVCLRPTAVVVVVVVDGAVLDFACLRPAAVVVVVVYVVDGAVLDFACLRPAAVVDGVVFNLTWLGWSVCFVAAAPAAGGTDPFLSLRFTLKRQFPMLFGVQVYSPHAPSFIYANDASN